MYNITRTYILYSLCSRAVEDVCPLVRVVELSGELWSKVSVSEVRPVVLLHEEGVGREFLSLPVVPEPLAPKGGHGEDPPVEKDPHLGLIIPSHRHKTQSQHRKYQLCKCKIICSSVIISNSLTEDHVNL